DCSGTDTPASRPTSRAHWPAQLTTISLSIGPSGVTTPATWPCSALMAVTGQSSTMETPAVRAPLASAWAISAGGGWGRVGGRGRSADEIGNVHDGPDVTRLLGREQVHLQPEAGGGRRLALDLGHALSIAGQAKPATALPARGLACLRLEPVIELDAVLQELGD